MENRRNGAVKVRLGNYLYQTHSPLTVPDTQRSKKMIPNESDTTLMGGVIIQDERKPFESLFVGIACNAIRAGDKLRDGQKMEFVKNQY